MKILVNGIFQNIPANKVQKYDITETNYAGNQAIINVKKIHGDSIMVYNFEYDLNDVLITDRTVVANGINTLDLYAQKEHEIKLVIG